MKTVLFIAWIAALSLLVGTVAGPSLAGGADSAADRPPQTCPYLGAQNDASACPYTAERPACPYRDRQAAGCPYGGAGSAQQPVGDLRSV